jgi:hypothetical protein
MQAACNRAKWARFSDSQHAQHGGPGPRVMQPAHRMLRACNCTRHLRHHRASSTVEPIPRLKATQRMTQRCQPGVAVSAAKNRPAAMTVADGQEQQSRRQPSSRPIRGQRENPLSWREDNAPVFRPRTARACATAAPPTTRPVALTSRRDRRRLWQEKRATLRLRHNDRISKGTPRRSISYPFPFSSFSLLQ